MMSASKFVQISRRQTIPEEEFYPLITAMYEEIWTNLMPPQLATETLPTKISRNIVTPADQLVPDCVTCGACCGALICVAVGATEQVADEHCWDVTTPDASGGDITVDRFLRRDGETLSCANLGGVIGERVGCEIYEQRPQMCRVFEAGSDKCRALRRAYNIEPFLTLEEMTTARRKLREREQETIEAQADTIRDAKIAVRSGTELLEIKVLTRAGALETIHVFDPRGETWRQYEFSGLTLAQAKGLIDSRTRDESTEPQTGRTN